MKSFLLFFPTSIKLTPLSLMSSFGTGWKKYGGVHQMNQLNNVSVYSIASDVLTLRQGYYGAFDVCGELHVSDNARFDRSIFSENLYVQKDVSANRLFVENITVHNSDVSVFGNLHVATGDLTVFNDLDIRGNVHCSNAVYLGDSGQAFFYGAAGPAGNVGLNTFAPAAAFDVSSAQTTALHVASSGADGRVIGVFETAAQHHAVVVEASTDRAEVRFCVDTPYGSSSSSSTEYDAAVQYRAGGTLVLDVSDNTQVRSRMTVFGRRDTDPAADLPPVHLMDETVTIYDSAAAAAAAPTETTVFLPDVYDNSGARTGKAMALVGTAADDATTFVHFVTPTGRGMALGGGAYPVENETDRSFGTLGWASADPSSNAFLPAMNWVTGRSRTHHKMTVGVNRHAPHSHGQYVLDVNGPVHIQQGDVTAVHTAGYEIVRFDNSKGDFGASMLAVAVGSPSTAQAPFKQQVTYSVDAGETWTTFVFDLCGTSFETNGVTVRDVCVVDNSFALVVGGLNFAFFSRRYVDATAWLRIIFPSTGTAPSEIFAVYVHPLQNRAFFGYTNRIVWTDLGTLVYTDNDGLTPEDLSFNTLSLPGSGLRCLAGDGDTLWLVYGTKLLKYVDVDTVPVLQPSATYDAGINHTSLTVLPNNGGLTVCAVGGGNRLSFTRDGGTTWTTVAVDGAETTLACVCLLDANNALAVGKAGVILYSTDGYLTWSPVPYGQLNTSGNADRLLDPRYDLTNLSCIDSAHFYLTQTRTRYVPGTGEAATAGQSRIFYLHLPNLFLNDQNYVLDVSGSVRVAGDFQLARGSDAADVARLLADAATVHLLDASPVTTLYVGGGTDAMYLGSRQGGSGGGHSNVFVTSSTFDVAGNSRWRGPEHTVAGNLSLEQSLTVEAEATFRGAAVFEQTVDVQGNAHVHGLLQSRGNFAVLGETASFAVDAIVGRDLYVTETTVLQGNLFVEQGATVYGLLDVTDDVVARQDLVVLSDVSVNHDVFVGGTIFANYLEGLQSSTFSTPDIYIGSTNLVDCSSRNIKIGNFNNRIDTSNQIFLGGPSDTVTIDGNVTIRGTVSQTQTQNVEAGPFLFLNSEAKPASSGGSGLKIGDDGRKDAGYVVVSDDRQGFVLKPTLPTDDNVVKFNVVQTVLPASFSTGLVGITRLNPDVADAYYSLSTSAIDPSNIVLKNKTLGYDAVQVIDTSFSVLGKLLVGNAQTNPDCALVVNGNVHNPNGYIWQF